MFSILNNEFLNPTVCRMTVSAPRVAKKAEPGQFVILRADADGERIPLTVADFDREAGTVTVIYQLVGATTKRLAEKKAGDFLPDLVGPLGKATRTEGLKRVCIIGGGVGCAIAYPVAKKLFSMGCEVTSIIGFRTRELVILEDAFRAVSTHFSIMTDDGSYGKQGNVCMPLGEMLKEGKTFDEVITIGPLIMMKFVVEALRPYKIPCTVSMNPIMIDGTGMCGGCRLTVLENGERKTRFACVDGPDFDGYAVDFDEAMRRGGMYRTFERHAYEQACHLFDKEANDRA